MEVRVHIQRTLNQLEGRSLFRDAASDMVSPTVLAAIPSSLPDDDQRTTAVGRSGRMCRARPLTCFNRAP